jgi:hypothetical protein
MATPNRETRAQHWIVRFLPLQTLSDAQDLAIRYKEVEGFQLYVLERKRLVIPALVFFVLVSIACAAGIVVFLAETYPLLVLPALVLAPVVLVASLLVQLYVFFYWLENRALAQALGHRPKAKQGPVAAWLLKKWGVDMGAPPPVPWILAAIVLIAPLVMLARFALAAVLLMIVVAVLMPIVFARLDR